MTALTIACFGLCISAGGFGARCRRLAPQSAWRILADGAFASSAVLLLHLAEDKTGMFFAIFAGSLSVAACLIATQSRLLVIQRIIWVGFGAVTGAAALLLLLL